MKPFGRVCHAMRRLSSNSMTVLTIEYGTPSFIAIAELIAELHALASRSSASRTEPEPSIS